ncbi:MAG: ribonuclease E/G [Roseburia sp.]|nr:ribonuclease E/G [Roseburia sp.]
MNRYIITRETIKGQEYVISALYDEKKRMLEVLPEPVGGASLLGNIYIGKVENIVKNLNAAFVKITPDQRCYLPLEELKHPVFTKKVSAKKELVQGDELLVQVEREALKTKEPAVTANLSLTGKYVVLTTGNHRIGVSSKLPKEKREHFKELLSAEARDYGIIVRTNAANVTEEEVLKELEELEARYQSLVESAQFKTCYSLLYQEPPECLKHLRDLREDMLEEIVTDDPALFEEVCAEYGIGRDALMTKGSVPVPVSEVVPKEGVRIRHHDDPGITLSALYGVSAQLKDAISERVWLKSGAYLIIQPTEAMTVIDVNTGKNMAKKEVQENFLRVNKEAAEEIARQLRLRNLSGIIVVDFMNLKSEEAKAELLSHFRAALRNDPVPTQLVDMTKLGLVEVTRKKVKKSLREVIG